MYVSEKDIDTLNDLICQIEALIEGGAEAEYWQTLHHNAMDLFEKAKYSHYTTKRKRQLKHKIKT